MSTVLTEPIYHVELIDGREIEKPLPKRFHARVQQRIQMELQKQIGNHLLEVLPALNVRCGEDWLVPDIVVASQNAHYDADDLIEGAYLAIEILSPGQTIGFYSTKPTAWSARARNAVGLSGQRESKPGSIRLTY